MKTITRGSGRKHGKCVEHERSEETGAGLNQFIELAHLEFNRGSESVESVGHMADVIVV